MALVCSCYGVNDRRIRREIEHGATTIDELAAACKAGSCCQNCHPTLDELLTERTTPVAVPRRRRLLFA